MRAESTAPAWRTWLGASLLLAALLAPTLFIAANLRTPEESKRRLLLALLPLALLPAAAQLPRALRRFSAARLLAILAPWTVFLISGIHAGREVPALDRTALLAGLLLTALLVSTLPPAAQRFTLGGIGAAGLAVAGWGVGESLAWLPALAGSSSPNNPVSFFGNVAFSSELVLPAAFVALFFATRSRGRATAAFWVLLHLIMVLYLALAGTLAALAIYLLIGAFASAIALHQKARRARLAATTLAAGGALMLALFLAPSPQAPAGSDGAGGAEPVETAPPSDWTTARVRLDTWAAILTRVLPAHPILGLGAGSFDELFPPYRSSEEARLSARAGASTVVNSAHDDPLEILAETGVLGFLAALLAAAALLATAWRSHRNPSTRWLWAGAAALALNALVRSPLLDNAPSALVFWILLGVLLARSPERIPSGRPRTVDWCALALLVPALLWGGWRGWSGHIADLHALSFAAEQQRSATAAIAPLETALRLDPTNYYHRLLLARVITARADGDLTALRRALEEVRRVRSEAPYLIEALELEAQLHYELGLGARSRDGLLAGLTRSLSVHQRILALDPVNEKASANCANLRFYLARLKGDAAAAQRAATDYLELRPAPQHRERFERELRAMAWEAFAAGRFTPMHEAFEALIALSPDPARTSLEIARTLQSRALSAGAKQKQFGLFYGKKFTIDGLEIRFLEALASRDRKAARRRWQNLARYPEYAELPVRSLDEAALRFLEGKPFLASLLAKEALNKGLRHLGERRRRILGDLFAPEETLGELLRTLLQTGG